MRLKPLLLLALALLLAVGTATFARRWLDAERQTMTTAPAPAPEKPAQSVLVARRPLALGQILKGEDLAWQPWPDNPTGSPYIMAGTKKPEDFAGSVVRAPLLAGEPITPDRVVAPGERGFLAAVLHPGMRAASIAVTATSGISGFVLPGDRVDILLTHIIPQPSQEGAPSNLGPNAERRATETVLRDIRVLAVDQKLETKAGEAVVAHTATVEVTDKQSELLALVAEMGKLSLSLCSLAQDTHDGVGDMGTSEPSYTLDSQVSHLLAPPHSKPATDIKISVLHGGKADDVTLPGAK